MIIISKSKSIKQPFLVKYLAKNNEVLSTSELLKSKKAAWKNIFAMAKNFCDGYGDEEIGVLDDTIEGSKPFDYTLDGLKKKAGVRK